MLAQHGVHVAAYRDFPSGDVIHDFKNLAVYVPADIDALAGFYLIPLQKYRIISGIQGIQLL